MLALYHLFSGTPIAKLPNLDAVVARADGYMPEEANRAVLVGTALPPGQTRRKADGTEVHTLWGELAWQLAGADGYALVADSDRRGTSPGSDVLKELFEVASPALILIDELIAYVRQLYRVDGLPGGAFEANLSFVQSLTEAARQASGTLVVATLPASDIRSPPPISRSAVRVAAPRWSACAISSPACNRPGARPAPKRGSRSCAAASSNPSPTGTNSPRAMPWSRPT
jgi:predicted AAA+ superfamily ATPase